MKQKRFTDEQIIGILKEADAGMVVADLSAMTLTLSRAVVENGHAVGHRLELVRR